jgi:hypothetical protein
VINGFEDATRDIIQEIVYVLLLTFSSAEHD